MLSGQPSHPTHPTPANHRTLLKLLLLQHEFLPCWIIPTNVLICLNMTLLNRFLGPRPLYFSISLFSFRAKKLSFSLYPLILHSLHSSLFQPDFRPHQQRLLTRPPVTSVLSTLVVSSLSTSSRSSEPRPLTATSIKHIHPYVS